MSTVLVDGTIGPTAEDAGDSGCIPGDMTVEQYQEVYRRWTAGELGDEMVQAQYGKGVLELLQKPVCSHPERGGGHGSASSRDDIMVMPGQVRHTEGTESRHELE